MRLLIFDVDGTLVDSQNYIVEAQRRAFAAVGVAAPSREASLSIVGLSLDRGFSTLVGTDGPIDNLVTAYRAAWGDMRHDPEFRDPLFPGAQETIDDLARDPDVCLGIATGKSMRGVLHLFDQAGWQKVFKTVQTSDDNPSKPAPDMLLRALAETGFAAGDAVMIGDTTFDMEMAQAAGVRAIGCAWGYHPEDQLIATGAGIVARDYPDLRRILGMKAI